MSPRVSTIIRTYNRAQYLPEAIDSVLAQTYGDYELIVVDDGSTDGTRALLERYGERLRPLFREHSGNLAALCNAGIRAARGELIAFLDSDDLWLPGKLAVQVPLLDDNARFGFVYGNACLLLPGGTRSAPVLRPEEIVAGDVLRPMVRNMCVHISTVLMRRVHIDESGCFDERHAQAEDLHFFLRLARLVPGVCLPEPVALVRRHAGQISAQRNVERYEEATSALTELLRSGPLPAGTCRDAHRSIARYETHMARVLLEHGRDAEARPHLRRAMAHYPLHPPLWRWLWRALLSALRTRN